MTDPNGWVQNPPTTFVKVINTSREVLNGRYGLCLQYIEDKSRYMILLVPTGDVAPTASTTSSSSVNNQEQVLLKTENLIACTFIEKCQAQYNLLRYNPEIQNTVLGYYEQIKNKTGVKPEYLGIGILLIFAVLIYLIGFTSVLLLLSFGLLIFTIIAPDLQTGDKTPKQIINNMPLRWKNLLREQIPYGYGPTIVNNQYAFYAVTILTLFMFLKPLIPFSAASKATVAAAAASTNTAAGLSAITIEHMNQIYKLGYDDATATKEFGTSLPQSMVKIRDLLGIAAVSMNNDDVPMKPKVLGAVDDEDDTYSWKSTPTPVVPHPTATKSIGNLFNFANLLGLFTLYRILEPISKNAEGKFDYQLFIANLKTLDPWKLGVIGFSIYRIISQFM